MQEPELNYENIYNPMVEKCEPRLTPAETVQEHYDSLCDYLNYMFSFFFISE